MTLIRLSASPEFVFIATLFNLRIAMSNTGDNAGITIGNLSMLEIAAASEV
jgi:hypothetical protein